MVGSNLDPLVSVGVPNYNGSAFIIETLESINAQTYTNLEVIIVDDASTDNSVQLINEWILKNDLNNKFRLIRHHQNGGPCTACATFLSNCNGTYFQYVGSDDLLMPDKITKQLALLAQLGPDYAFVYSDANLIDENGVGIGDSYLNKIGYNLDCMPTGDILNELLSFNFIQSCTPLIRTSYVYAVGGFNTDFWVEDYDLWLRLASKYSVAFIPEQLALYRIHSNSLTNTKISWARTIDEALHMRFKYYQKLDSVTKVKLKGIIKKDALALYSFNSQSSKFWLRKSLLLQPSWKVMILYILSSLGIRFNLIHNFKYYILKFLKFTYQVK